jgi:hypothetical protein
LVIDSAEKHRECFDGLSKNGKSQIKANNRSLRRLRPELFEGKLLKTISGGSTV